jgi:hypothetical protein
VCRYVAAAVLVVMYFAFKYVTTLLDRLEVRGLFLNCS